MKTDEGIRTDSDSPDPCTGSRNDIGTLTPNPPDAPGHRPEIDGLRAIAVLAVIAFHANGALRGGFAGVDVFFVISGYLITAQIWRETRDGRFSFLAFWTRRIRRIAPACVAMALGVLLAGTLLLLPSKLFSLSASVLWLTLMASNFYFARGTDYFAPATDQEPLLHTWSLAVEEQFYLFLPASMLWLSRKGPAAVRIGIVGVAVASFVCALIGASQWPFENFYWPFGRGWELLLGSCLAVFPGPKGRSRWHGPGAAAGVILILLACAFADSGSGYPGARALVPTVGTALVLHCTSAGPNTTGRLLSLAPLRGIGVISYSLYLWHWPVLAFMRCTIASQLSGVHLAWAFAIMLLLGFLSWRFVEQPFRGMANGAEGRRKLLQGFFVASIGLALLAGTVRATRGLAARPWIREVVGSQGRERGANHAHEAPAQLPSDVASLPRLGACADPLHADFLLWGDSHAMALSSCLDRRARETGICGVAAIRAGRVPLLDPADTLRDRGVESWGADVLSLAASSGVRNLVLCAYWSSYFLRGTGLTDPAALAHADRLPWRMVLDTTLQRAVEAGMDVWILGEVPTQELTPGQALVRGWWSGAGLESVGVDSRSHASRAALLEEALEDWSRHPKVHIVRLGDACFGSNGYACMGNREMAYYFDRSHLSDDGAEHLLRQVLGDLCVSIRLRSSESTPHQ